MSCWDKCPKVIRHYKNHPDEAAKNNYDFPNCENYTSPERTLSEKSFRTSYHDEYRVSSKDSLDSIKKAKIKADLLETQQKVDDYILNKGWNYFRNRNYCNCTYACTFYHLWHDSFFSSTLNALVLFVIGVKLCYELDGMNVFKHY